MYYRLKSDNENFRNYIFSKNLTSAESVNLTESFDGRSHKDNYETIYLKMTAASERKYPIADFQESQVIICSDKTKRVIEEFCDENEIEFLQCILEDCNDAYYIINVLSVEDCVDYDKSKFTRFPSTGRIMFFEHIALKEHIDRHIFRIKDIKYGYFISKKLKDRLESAGLKGLIFDNKLFI